jgi:hypothetical protein
VLIDSMKPLRNEKLGAWIAGWESEEELDDFMNLVHFQEIRS